MNAEIGKLMKDFEVKIVATVREQVRAELIESIGRTAVKATSHVSKVLKNGAVAPAAVKPPRKKGPVQLCPAPGCKERAAPIFGMVCAKHKGTPKKTIAKWREDRRKKAAKK